MGHKPGYKPGLNFQGLALPMRDRDRYLKQREDRFYYQRRVPRQLAATDPRGTVRIALKTDSIAEARHKRDQLEKADDLYWSALSNGHKATALKRYSSAVERALAHGFTYMPAPELADNAALEELLARIDAAPSVKDHPVTEAILGHAPRPKPTVSEAFEIYVAEIAAANVTTKSPAQHASWLKAKRRAVSNFVKVIGDLPLEDITRDHARQFYQWWLARVVPPGDSPAEPLSADTAKRDMGNMRKLFASYAKHIGKDDIPNPFRNMSFSTNQLNKRAAFSTEWMRDKILKPGALASLNIDARLIVYALVETGARPSEICNLLPENIILDAPIPYISIRSTSSREIKTRSSTREIPLVGVSLAAMQRAKDGFSRYRDRETTLSATLTKAFRAAKLFPTSEHYIYSLRHSFEKRMTEAGIDYGLRCLLMGHTTKRPVYGDGGSMQYRRDELAKIVLPYSPALFTGVP